MPLWIFLENGNTTLFVSNDKAQAHSGMEREKLGSSAIEWVVTSNPRAFAVARHEGRIAGISAYVMSRMKFGDNSGVGLQAIDSFVAGDMRAKGIFTKLARAYDEHARQTDTDLVWGFPNENAAPAWFQKLGWYRQGQVPFLVKPLRAGLFLRKINVPISFPVSFARDQGLPAASDLGAWADGMWEEFASGIGCATIRDQEFLRHRLFRAPQSNEYRVVTDSNPMSAALVATREAKKHGGHIAYLMEAMGGSSLRGLLLSELGRLRNRGVEAVLAWAFPWSPNYHVLRRAGFFPLPKRVRPIRIWFGSRPHSLAARCANETKQWYLSYLDSDTV